MDDARNAQLWASAMMNSLQQPAVRSNPPHRAGLAVSADATAGQETSSFTGLVSRAATGLIKLAAIPTQSPGSSVRWIDWPARITSSAVQPFTKSPAVPSVITALGATGFARRRGLG